MCGICGFYGFEDRQLLRKMTDTLIHRGPDDSGYYTDRNVSLGQRRLSIIDLKTGKQPIFNEDRSMVIVFNGEIYNFQEIRDNLEKNGHIFSTNSDTETIVHAYEEYGHNCLKKFRGMFAFALWDSRKKELFLARDHTGIKPLFYYSDKDRFIFASEIKSILETGIKKKINPLGLEEYLTFGFSHEDRTLLTGVKRLLPGHHLTVNHEGISVGKYWSVEMNETNMNLNDAIKGFRRAFEESVKLRMISDVPLGAYLSGGLDSSAVVAFMSKHADEPVKTFSVGFGSEGDELEYARIISEKFGTDHHEKIVEYKYIPKLIEKLVWHADDCMSDAALLPTFLISEVAKKKVKVVLTGEGADELFGGYDRYTYLTGLKHRLFPSLCNKMYMYQMTLFREGEKKKLMGNNNIDLNDYYDGRTLNDATDFELRTAIPNQLLVKVDRATMASSVEARVPFLDRKLMEFSEKLPQNLKIYGSESKFLLKKALADDLPKDIIYRKKHGFSVPLARWFQGDLKDYASQMLLDSEMNKNLGFNEEYIKKLLPTSKGFRRSGDAFRVWRLLVLGVWWEKVLG